MTLISALCFALALAGILSMFVPRTDVLSPARLLLAVWAVAIGLADLKLSHYQHVWSAYSWIVLLSGVGAMFVGLFMSYVIFMHRPMLSIEEVRRSFMALSINEDLLFKITMGLFLVYFLSFCAEVGIMGGVPIMSARPDRARVEFGVFGIHLLVTSMPVLLYLVVQYFLFVRGQTSRKWILAVVFAIAFVTFLTLLQRFLFVAWALMTLALAYYVSRRIRLRHLMIVGAVFSSVLVYIQSLRLSVYVGNFFEVVSRMKYGTSLGVFIEPYMYVTMNLENFARAVDKLDNFALGYFTADPIMALTGLKHWLAEYYGIIERPFLISGYNTYPFLWTYYHDFGILGVMVFPLLLGLAIGAIHARLRRDPGLVSLALYTSAVFFIFISFFTNPLAMLVTASNIVLLAVVQWYLSVRSV